MPGPVWPAPPAPRRSNDDGDDGQAPRLVVVDRLESTSTTLLEEISSPGGRVDPAAARRWPHLSALQAVHQTAGRGRGTRRWQSLPECSLTVSFLLRPRVAATELGWLPVLAGAAVRQALADGARAAGTSLRVGTKWPNDVVLDPARSGPWLPGWGRTRKVAGVLVDLLPPATDLPAHRRPRSRAQAFGAVVGIGVNVGHEETQLPVAWSTSLALAGWRTTPAQVRDLIGVALARTMDRWEHHGLDGTGPSLRRWVEEGSWVLGRQVTVSAPDGQVRGRAVGIDPALVVETGGRHLRVQAGDVALTRLVEGGDGTGEEGRALPV